MILAQELVGLQTGDNDFCHSFLGLSFLKISIYLILVQVCCVSHNQRESHNFTVEIDIYKE